MNKTGFGFLRLPQTVQKSIDYEILNPMVDRFLELGGTYFDTAYTYLNGQSEEAIRKSLVQRHPRDSFALADKLPGYKVTSYDQCRSYFEEQLQRCAVEYFDVYLLHWLNEKNYEIAEQQDEFRFLRELKARGEAKEIGFSYHDSPELLDKILYAHPEVDIVQLQINYLDWDSVSLQAGALYDVAVKHGKKVVVMEPVKGGSLAEIPTEAKAILQSILPEDSSASWAIRFATDLEQVSVVLSGMNTMAQLEDNMRPFGALTHRERKALEQCAQIIRANTAIGCTGCAYCVSHCPIGMPIPRLFALYNDYARSPAEGWKMKPAYQSLSKQGPNASACLACGECEKNCPQGLGIIKGLQAIKRAFEG